MLKFIREYLVCLAVAAMCLASISGSFSPPKSNAANISALSGPNDPAGGQLTINSLIQSINTGVSGLLNSQFTASGTGADTTEDTLYTYSLPANALKTPGQTLHVHCWGATGATVNNKTMKLYFGASTITTPTAATNAKGWDMRLDVTRAATGATQVVVGNGSVDVTPITTFNNAGTDDMTAGITIKCTGTNGTAAANDVAGKGMTVEMSQ